MSIVSEPKVRAVQVPNSNVYVTVSGLKVGAKGKVLPAGLFYASLPSKGEARKLRKALRTMGRSDLSGVTNKE